MAEMKSPGIARGDQDTNFLALLLGSGATETTESAEQPSAVFLADASPDPTGVSGPAWPTTNILFEGYPSSPPQTGDNVSAASLSPGQTARSTTEASQLHQGTLPITQTPSAPAIPSFTGLKLYAGDIGRPPASGGIEPESVPREAAPVTNHSSPGVAVPVADRPGWSSSLSVAANATLDPIMPSSSGAHVIAARTAASPTARSGVASVQLPDALAESGLTANPTPVSQPITQLKVISPPGIILQCNSSPLGSAPVADAWPAGAPTAIETVRRSDGTSAPFAGQVVAGGEAKVSQATRFITRAAIIGSPIANSGAPFVREPVAGDRFANRPKAAQSIPDPGITRMAPVARRLRASVARAPYTSTSRVSAPSSGGAVRSALPAPKPMTSSQPAIMPIASAPAMPSDQQPTISSQTASAPTTIASAAPQPTTSSQPAITPIASAPATIVPVASQPTASSQPVITPIASAPATTAPPAPQPITSSQSAITPTASVAAATAPAQPAVAPIASAPATTAPAVPQSSTISQPAITPIASVPTTTAPAVPQPTTGSQPAVAPIASAPATTALAAPQPTTSSQSAVAPIASVPATTAPAVPQSSTISQPAITPIASVPTTTAPAAPQPTTSSQPAITPTASVPGATAPAPPAITSLVSAPATIAPAAPQPTTVSQPAVAPIASAPATTAPATPQPTTVSQPAVAPIASAPAMTAPAAPQPTTVSQPAVAPIASAPVKTAPATPQPATSSQPAITPIAGAPVTTAPATPQPTTSSQPAITPIASAPVTTAPAAPQPTTVSQPAVAPIASAPVTTAPATPQPTTSSQPIITPIASAPVTTAPGSRPIITPIASAPATITSAASQPITSSQPAITPTASALRPIRPVTTSAVTNGSVENASGNPSADAPTTLSTSDSRRPSTKLTDRQTAGAAWTESFEKAPPSLPVAPLPPLVAFDMAPQTETPSTDTSSGGDPAPSSNVNAPPPVTVAAAPQLTAEVAFGARIVEQDIEEPAADDSFVSSSSLKPANAAPDNPANAQTTPQPLSHAAQSASDGQPGNQHKDPPRQDKPSPAPPPPGDTAALKPAELANPVSRWEPAGSGNPVPQVRTDPIEPSPESQGARVVEVPAMDPRPTQPVRDVTLHLTSDTQQVDVKLIDRGGELHVAVQSADPVLNSDLRASVHDLISGLEKSGFHAEAWPPGDTPRHNSEILAGTTRNAGDQPHSQMGEDPRRQGRNAQNPDAAPARRSRRSNAEWMKHIDALIGAGKGV